MSLRGATTRSYTRLCQNGVQFGFSSEPVPSGAVQITTNDYTTAISPNKVYSLLLTIQTQKDLLTGIAVETEYSYDTPYNLPLTVTTRNYSGQELQQTHSVTTEYQNNPQGTDSEYYIGRPQQVSTTTTAYSDIYTTEQTYSYDDKGNVITLEKKGHNPDSYGIGVKLRAIKIKK